MRYESIEDIAVNPAEVVYGVAAVAGPACGHFPDVRLGLERTCRHEVVLHVQARVVARYLLCPFLPERCGAASVGQYGHISLRRHQAVVPPVGPALAERALRSSQADEDGRIFLAAVEMRRIDHPCEHVLSVHCLYVPRFCLHGVELREYGVIHMCYLADVHVTLHSAGSGVLCETSSGAAAIVHPSGVPALSPILMLTSSVGKSMLL